MQKSRKNIWLIVFAVVVLLAVVVSLPPVWSRVSSRAMDVYRTIKYAVQPPNKSVFVPSTQKETPGATSVSGVNQAGGATEQATVEPTATAPQPTVEITNTPAPTSTPAATFTPTPTEAPLPTEALLKGFIGEKQFMNNCGPATLSIYLSYYQWGKNQAAAAAVLKPNVKDVNVMPYEIADFVNNHTEQRALWRYGGDMQTIKKLVNAGFPVMIEKSFEPFDLRSEGWMGHYNLVVGYNDETEILTVQDSYLLIHVPWGGEIPQEMLSTFIGFDFYYSELEQAWRSFNDVFVVVYPPEKEEEVLRIIGPLADPQAAAQIAYDHAMKETTTLTEPRDLYFAWFNAGTSLVALKEYEKAAEAFDKAWAIYPDIPEMKRPYRILWYESGPYAAYYNSGRYQDVIDLASQTLGNMAEPVIEEAYYWRAMSYNALGEKAKAVADLRSSIKFHPGYAPSEDLLKQLGETP